MIRYIIGILFFIIGEYLIIYKNDETGLSGLLCGVGGMLVISAYYNMR
jgi:drug/metabolite transporter (DMT)-like permease